MGTLSYTLPTLGATGTQPATDVTAALSALKTELTALMEAANLADNGISNKADLGLDTTYDYADITLGGTTWVTPELIIPAGSLLSIMIRVVVTGGNDPVFQGYINGTTTGVPYLLSPSTGGSDTWSTRPGDGNPVTSEDDGSLGAPILYWCKNSTTFRISETGASNGRATATINLKVYGGFS